MASCQVIQERRKKKRDECYAPVKKDLLDLIMDMYDEETDSRMDNEELRSQVCTVHRYPCLITNTIMYLEIKY